MHAHRAAAAYSRVGLETGVAAASPHRLILMLFDGTLRAIAEASAHLDARRIPDKGLAASRAIGIIEEGLKPCLDADRGGAIAAQLMQLYDYLSRRILLASLANDPAGFDETAALLRELRAAWADIEPSGTGAGGPQRAAA
jgi:flagellar protein FliS